VETKEVKETTRKLWRNERSQGVTTTVYMPRRWWGKIFHFLRKWGGNYGFSNKIKTPRHKTEFKNSTILRNL
jgi:hypothetical protein